MESNCLQTSSNHWQSLLLSILLALTPISLAIDQRLKALPVALLFLAGLGVLASDRNARESFRRAWPVVIAALLMFAFVFFNVFVHRLGWRPVDRAAHILLFLVIAAIFTQPLRLRLVWAGFSLTAIGLGAVCLVQHYAHGIQRPFGLNGGESAAIELATVLLGLTVVALVQLLDLRTPKLEKLLHLTAVGLGLCGAVLTQSRGPLLAFVPVFVTLMIVHARRSGHWRASVLLAVAVCLLAGMATFNIRHQMVARFEAIAPEVSSFDHHHDGHGSVRERLEMWRTAGRAFKAHPFLGIGIDRFDGYIQDEIAAGRSSPAISGYNQPHDEYLEAASSGGVPGLLVLLLVFALPLRYFFQHACNPDNAIAMPALMGVGLIILYVLCAITASVFYRIMTQSFYFFLVLGLALLIAAMLRKRSAAAAQRL